MNATNKKVEDMTTQELYEAGLECPINNGADLQSGELLASLFDEGQYAEGKVNDRCVAIGFVAGIPVKCEYGLGYNWAWVTAIMKKKECNYTPLDKVLPVRMSDEQVYAQVNKICGGVFVVGFYYRSKD